MPPVRLWLLYLRSSTCLGHSQAHAQDSVCAQVGLVLRPVELDQEVVNGRLILHVDTLLDKLGANCIVYILDSFRHTFSSPLRFVPVAEFASLMLS